MSGVCNNNPEARFIGTINCMVADKGKIETESTVTVNIEVKSPGFPHKNHESEKIAIPTVLLTDSGREDVKKFCEERGVRYIPPRVLKLKDFLNSATSKFTVPQNNEFNLLYINWSYSDFPSNSFLEPWSLLTNEKNGILRYPEIAESIGISPDVFKKITAVIVYTESLEGLMFSDFRYVWQRNRRGPRFRMWVINEKLRNAELDDKSNVLFNITGMNPDKELTQLIMTDCKSTTITEEVESAKFCVDLISVIEKNIKR